MHIRVPISSSVLDWAIRRAEWSENDALKRFPRWDQWYAGESHPTWKQAEEFAQATGVPFGRLFLPEPPDELLPLADFRRRTDARGRPSGNLLDTLYACIDRQDWYREYAMREGLRPIVWVGTASTREPVAAVAETLRETLGLTADARRDAGDANGWLRRIRQALDGAGVLVMMAGVVEQNATRALNPEEFRGFALSDPLAPLIFVNTRDAKAAQVFTLAHELGHLCLGETGISNAPMNQPQSAANEHWCNAFAAEFLVPGIELRQVLGVRTVTDTVVRELGGYFRASRLVILRRLLDVAALTRSEFQVRWRTVWAESTSARAKGSGGGDFYATHRLRLGPRLLHAVIQATESGNTSYSDAFRLAGVKSLGTFREVVQRIGREG